MSPIGSSHGVRSTEAIPSLHDGRDADAVSRYDFNGDVTDGWGTNDGTDNTSAGFVDGIRGQAKSFDGIDDHIDMGDSADWDFSTGSWAAWVNTTELFSSDSVNERILARSPTTNDPGQIDIFGDSNDDKIHVNIPFVEADVVVGSTALSTDTWYHVAVTKSGDNWEIYLNGDSDGTGTDSGSMTLDGPLIVGDAPNTDGHWHGQIEDVRIYSRQLSRHEIDELYRWGLKA